MRIKWLHLSDIHFNYKNYDSHSLRTDFLKRIQSLDQSEPFTHLFITGDILYGNQKADAATGEFIRALSDIMNLSKEKVFIVPGNHDHDRNITKSTLKELFKKNKKKDDSSIVDNLTANEISLLLKSHENFFEAYSSVLSEQYYNGLDKPHLILPQAELSIIKLNTSWLDVDSKKENDYLRIGTRFLQMALSEKEEELKRSINIAIGHHTLEDMLPQERNRVLDQFKRHNVGLYFCGHRHKPNIRYFADCDVLEFVAPGGYNDGYSNGGYIWGILDTDCDFYKAETYSWYDGKWCIENRLDGTDEYGIYYFNTKKFKHNTNIVAIDCKTIGGHIPKRDLEKSLQTQNFDVHIYNGPHDDVNGYTQDSIKDFSENIIQLVEKNDIIHLYPLAPIPMLVSLGFNLQKGSNIIVHQFDRNTQSWTLNEKTDNITLLEPECDFADNQIIAVVISTSFEIEKSQIEDVLRDKSYDLVHFKTNEIAQGYPLYSADVDNVVKEIIAFLNSRVNSYNEIHLFAAIPAGFAVELGRHMLTTVYSNLYTYQLTQGSYKQALIINPKERHKDFSNGIFVDWYRPNNVSRLLLKGSAPCGEPNIGDLENGQYFPVLESLLSSGEHFVIRAKGDSMIGAGIEDGDYVIVEASPVAENGKIVIAMIDGEITIKRFFRDDEKQMIRLHPENDDYGDKYYTELDIQGIVVNVIKKI